MMSVLSFQKNYGLAEEQQATIQVALNRTKREICVHTNAGELEVNKACETESQNFWTGDREFKKSVNKVVKFSKESRIPKATFYKCLS